MHRLRSHDRHVPDGAVLGVVCLAQFMVVLDVSIVNVALPSIGRELHYSASGLQWVVNAYVLTFAGFLLLGGRFADLFGRRRVFLAGLALFSVASLLGGLAQNAGELTAARALQGLGGAVLSPATLTVIMTTFTDDAKRHRALGAWSAVAGAGGAMGAIFGGVLTSYLTWRWVLFVNVPIGAVGLVAALILLSEGRRPDAQRSLDIGGAILVTAGLGVLVYGIVGTSSQGWTSERTLGLICGGIALLAMFVYVQARVAAAPLMPLSLFRSRSLSSANVVMLLAGAGFFSMWYFLSLYLQDIQGNDPLQTGLLFLPMSAVIIVGARVSSRLITRIGVRPVLIAGLLGATAGFCWLSRLQASSSYAGGVLGGSLLTSLGVGLAFAPLAAAATAGVPMQLAGLASGLLNTARQVGGSLGLAILATLATSRTEHFAGGRKVAVTAGFDRAFIVAAAFTAVGVLAATAIPAARRAVPDEVRTAVGAPTPAAVD